MKRFYYILIICVLCFISCNHNCIYDDLLEIPNQAWIYDAPARFDVEIKDTTCFYKMSLNIRNQVNYEFGNLYLFVTMVLPDGRMARDTVNCMLANKDGRWIGKGISGVKDLSIPFRSEMLFPMSGNYVFYIEQAMRKDTLEGIQSIGIRIDKETLE